MRAHIYVGRDIEIPDVHLPRIVRAVKAERVRRCRNDPRFHEHADFNEFPVRVDEIVEKAVELGILKLDDISTDGDDDRKWWRGRLITAEEWFDIKYPNRDK
jgi:hypothetical protein